MHAWAAILPLADAGSLAPVRLAELETLEQGTDLWVRGRAEIPRTVPWREVFEIHGAPGGDVLRRPGELLGAGPMPVGVWQKLAAWLGVDRPALLREGLPPVRATLRLVPATQVQPAVLLATTAERWLAFVAHAPELRLRPLRFAQTETGRVFITGHLLPSIAGEYFTVAGQIAAPAGSTWEPALRPATLQATLGLAADETAVLLPEGGVLRIPARAWQPASRAAVRLLAQAYRDEY